MRKHILVDFHCHLDLYPDFNSILTECENQGVRTLAVTTTPRAWPRNRDLTKGTRYVRPALGLHPQLVGRTLNEELSLWEKYLPEARYIGEVGLDAGPRFLHTFQEQRKIFERILQCCAVAGGKILSVHSVRSASVVLDLVEANLPSDRGRVVLHWFTGDTVEADRGMKLGCYFSVNAEMLRTSGGRKLIATLPLKRILTETDGPFTEWNNTPSKPKDIVRIVKLLAEIRGITPDAMTNTISTNLKTLLASVALC